MIDALAPTNSLAGNPAALRKLAATKGTSLLRGLANLVDDIASGRGLPKQVDPRPFTVGRNLASTPGAVVFRNDLLELIQYAPTTTHVHGRPLVIVPPQINKFYVFDLTPQNSFVRAALDQGVQTSCVSWRNPTRERAMGPRRLRRGARRSGRCRPRLPGRPISTSPRRPAPRHHAVPPGGPRSRRSPLEAVPLGTLAVCVIDKPRSSRYSWRLFVTPKTVAAAKAARAKRGVVEGHRPARMLGVDAAEFDLVWNYVVNNYLLGNVRQRDILYWNNDTDAAAREVCTPISSTSSRGTLFRARRLAVRGRKATFSGRNVHSYVMPAPPITSRRGRACTGPRARWAAAPADVRPATAAASRA